MLTAWDASGAVVETQPTKVKVVGTLHVTFTRSSSKSWIADARWSVPATFVGCVRW